MRRSLPLALLALLATGAWLLLAPSRDRVRDEAPTTAPGGGTDAAGGPALKGTGHAGPDAAAGTENAPAHSIAGRTRVVGRVVDAGRRPVAGAEVAALFDGAVHARVTSDEAGAFTLPLGAPAREAVYGRLRVIAGTRGADQLLYVGPDTPDRLDYGPIVIDALHALTVRVLRAGRPVPGATVVAGPAVVGRERARFVPVRTGAEGLARFEGLTGKKVGVFAVAPGTGRGRREVGLPCDVVADLELPEDRTATIHVVRAGTQAPVAGAWVSLAGPGTRPFPRGAGCLPPLREIRTGPDGRAVVSGLPPGHVWVVARTKGLAMLSNGMMLERVILAPEDREATVTLHPYRAVRFPILETGAGPPPEGTVLALRRYQPMTGYDVGTPAARIDRGHLVLEPFPPGFDRGHVVAPDGRWAAWSTPLEGDLGDAIAFRKVHDVRVQLRWRDGTPAAGEILWALLRPRGRGRHARTDASGLVVFEQCVAETTVILWTSVETGFGQPVARVPLSSDPGTIEVTVDRPVDIALQIRIGGEPRLPVAYQVRVPDMDPDALRRLRYRDVRAEIVEDAARGEISFRWLALPTGAAPPVTIQAEDLPPATVTPVKDADGVWRATIELRAGTALRVRVTPPDGGRYRLFVERWIETQRRWRVLHDDPAYLAGRRAVDGVHTFRGFAPGRYRLRDHASGITSDAFELALEGDDLDLAFDLVASVEVRGRVVVPEGESAAHATVHVAGRTEGSVSRSNPVRAEPDGSFAFRARRGDRHRLEVRHPLLVPRETPGAFVVGRGQPVLHLVPGPQIVFRLAGSDLSTAAPDPSMYPAWWSPVHVRMTREGAFSAIGRGVRTIAKEGRFRAGVPAVGTWTVRIERTGYVPHLVEDLVVGAGPVDLGTISLRKGAALEVRLFRGERPVPKRLALTATRVGARPYTAASHQVHMGDPPALRVEGLGPGTFRVAVKRIFANAPALLEQEVESDGTTPITLDLRLP